MSKLAGELRRHIRGRVETDWTLAPLTTYRLGGPARVFVEVADTADAQTLGRIVAEAGAASEVLLLGRGSNLVISDRGWPGVVVRLGPRFARLEALEGKGGTPHGLVAGAAAPLPTLANWTARRGLSGHEFFVSIPGSVGGAVRMNAGAHDSEVAATLHSVQVLHLTSGDVEVRPAASLGLTYRHSELAPSDLVLEARFHLQPGERDRIRQRIESFRRHRAATQPGALQNAGSVFKNPPGDAAGRLVEAAGLKGFRVGGAVVSDLHANFFLASEQASAQDVFDLVEAVRARVAEEFDVLLEPEIRFAGAFRGAKTFDRQEAAT